MFISINACKYCNRYFVRIISNVIDKNLKIVMQIHWPARHVTKLAERNIDLIQKNNPLKDYFILNE